MLAASFLHSIFFTYCSAEGLNGPGDAEIRSLSSSFIFKKFKILKEEGKWGEVKTLLQSPSRAQIKKPHFTVKDQITWIPVDLRRVAISFQCLLDVSVKKDFFIISAEMGKSYGSVLKELRLVDDTKISSTAQLLPYTAFLLMEAKGAKTLSFDESDCATKPQLKAGSQFRQEKA